MATTEGSGHVKLNSRVPRPFSVSVPDGWARDFSADHFASAGPDVLRGVAR